MRKYILKRIILGILTMFAVSIIIFFAARLSGDVAVLLAGPEGTEEIIQQIHADLGLDKPLPIQYFIFISDALRGDFGRSIMYQEPAMQTVLRRIPATLELGLAGFSMAIFFGLLFGTLSASKKGGLLDWSCKLFAMLGQSVPGFWTGIMLILFFSVTLGWLPTSGIGGINHLILPAFSLGWYSIASIMRLTRSSMLDVLDTEYIKMARLKGNTERVVVWKHAFKNAMIPVVGLSGFQLALLIGGSVVIENIFRWPGMGSLMLDSIHRRDYPVIQAGVLLISFAIIMVNLIVDLIYGVIDPRIRYE